MSFTDRSKAKTRPPRERKDDTAIRITNQFRRLGSQATMVYELRAAGAGIVLELAQKPGAESWRIQATTMTTPPQAVTGTWAPSRAAALASVGKEWQSQEVALGLPPFDWSAMASRLAEVRAV